MTRVTYVSETPVFWRNYYMRGYGMQVYSGVPYQRGTGIGSFLKGIFRLAWPVLKQAGKAVAKEGVRTAASIAQDYASGEDLKTSAEKHSKQAVGRLLEKGSKKLQSGSGVGKRGKGKTKSIKRPKKPANDVLS